MNKRQRKKNEKKRMEFEDCYVSSYRELRKLNRMFHEYEVFVKRKEYDKDWIDRVIDVWNSIPLN